MVSEDWIVKSKFIHHGTNLMDRTILLRILHKQSAVRLKTQRKPFQKSPNYIEYHLEVFLIENLLE